jgi:cell wall-associated NlpC family hydrolase
LCIAVRKLTRVASLAAATAVLALAVPGAISQAQTNAPQPSLSELITQAKQLEFQINSLSEQYDGLRIQLSRAQANERIAKQAEQRDSAALAAGQAAISQLAAQRYMGSGLDPALQAFTAASPGDFLRQASTITEMDQSSGNQVSRLNAAESQALRARETAVQQIAAVQAIESQMNTKRAAINAKIDKVNSAAMTQAMAIYSATGQYPNVSIPTANTVGAQALQYALTKRGDPYVWGAAGPSEFDCSGLVVWAFAQVGISLPHYTGDLWNSGMHVSRNALEPGDLLFFFGDISHVAMYLGNGLMLEAVSSGIPVRVDPVNWGVYVGAVRIG